MIEEPIKPRYQIVSDMIGEVHSQDQPARMLEVGATPFVFSELILTKFPSLKLVGVGYGEGDKDQKEVADQTIDVKYCNVETDRWPFEDDSFDIVTMMSIIEHLFDPLAALSEARRVLKDDGEFILVTPNAQRLQLRIMTLFGNNPFDGFPLENKYNRHQHEYTISELKDLLSVAGFEIKDTRTYALDWDLKIAPLLKIGAKINSRWGDKIIVRAIPGEAENRLPSVYRQGTIESRSKHRLHDEGKIKHIKNS